jgi:cytochrome P450
MLSPKVLLMMTRRGFGTSLRDIPGPKEWPLLGTIPSFLKNGGIRTMLQQGQHNYKTYGPIYKTKLSGPEVHICDPRDWLSVYRNEGKYPHWSAAQAWPFVEYYKDRNVVHLTMTVDGEQWKENRAKTQRHFFSHADARKYLDLIIPVAEDFSRVAPKYQKDLRELSSAASFEMIATVCYNKRILAVTNLEGSEAAFSKLVCRMFTRAMVLMLSPNPLHKKKMSKEWKFFKLELDQIFNYVDQLTEESIGIFNKGRDANSEDYDRLSHSYVGKLLQDGTTDRELLSVNTVGLMFAGVDTTSHILRWFLINLAQNQEAQEKLLSEVRNVLNGRTLTHKDVEQNAFSYYKDCFKESMRHSPAINGVSRILPVDIDIQGYNIPKGTKLTFFPHGIQKDERYFDSPESYLPERWGDEEVSKRKEKSPEKHAVVDHPMVATEFSFGPRMCMGARISQYEIMSLVTRLIQDYKIELEHPEKELKIMSSGFNEPDPFPAFKLTSRKE